MCSRARVRGAGGKQLTAGREPVTTPGSADHVATGKRLTTLPVTLLGVPTSAGAHGPGQEQAPAALRALGLPQLLARSGVDLADGGDVAGRRFAAAARVDG